jgi:hypothetical protein
MGPTNERLDRDDGVVVERKRGLEVEPQLPGLDRAVELGRGLDPGEELTADPVV